MTRQFKIFSLIILFSFLLCSISLEQQKETLEELSRRIKVLEGQKENLLDSIKNKETELDLKFDKFKKDNDRFELLVFIIGPVSIIGLLVTIFVSIKNIRKKIAEKYEKLFDDEKERFIELIQKENEEYQLKQNKEILVLSKPGSKDDFIRKFFREFKFKKIHFSDITDIEKPNKIKEDVILFNDEDNQLSEKDILDVISGTKATIVNFYFGSKRINAGEYSYKTTFANARVQLYGNLINALRYQSLLK